ncbi:unnamed protein product, partial [Nesidiocoris tenuis]
AGEWNADISKVLRVARHLSRLRKVSGQKNSVFREEKRAGKLWFIRQYEKRSSARTVIMKWVETPCSWLSRAGGAILLLPFSGKLSGSAKLPSHAERGLYQELSRIRLEQILICIPCKLNWRTVKLASST